MICLLLTPPPTRGFLTFRGDDHDIQISTRSLDPCDSGGKRLLGKPFQRVRDVIVKDSTVSFGKGEPRQIGELAAGNHDGAAKLHTAESLV
jgi:hypothetical protein